jgi:hypothetical protein
VSRGPQHDDNELAKIESQADRSSLPLTRLGPWRRSDWLSLGLLVAIGTGLPLAVAVWTGSISIPHDDDWAYTRIAESFYLTHHLTSLGWGVMTLFGQIVSSQPLLYLTGNASWSFGLYATIFGATC